MPSPGPLVCALGPSQDAVVRGDISINMPRRQLEYAKRLPLGGSGAVLALAASCRLEGAPARPPAWRGLARMCRAGLRPGAS